MYVCNQLYFRIVPESQNISEGNSTENVHVPHTECLPLTKILLLVR